VVTAEVTPDKVRQRHRSLNGVFILFLPKGLARLVVELILLSCILANHPPPVKLIVGEDIPKGAFLTLPVEWGFYRSGRTSAWHDNRMDEGMGTFERREACGFGNPRHGRLGGLRYTNCYEPNCDRIFCRIVVVKTGEFGSVSS